MKFGRFRNQLPRFRRRLRLAKLLLCWCLGFLWTIHPGLLYKLPAQAQVTTPFSIRYQTNDTGDIVFVGNTLLTCPTSTSGCTTARGGTNTNGQNNSFNMVNVDVDSDGTTFNSSNAQLNLPAGSTVLFAGLYWGGDSSNAARNQVRLATPAGGYTNITGSLIGSSSYQNGYEGFANVTSLVQTGGNGTYAVANVQSTTGSTNRWAGWTLVIAYRAPGQPPRNLTVFDGLASINSSYSTVNIPISGFRTPPVGAVQTKFGAVAYDGDNGVGNATSSYTGDRLQLNSTNLSDALNPANDFFNSSITNSGTQITSKNPNYANQLGFDADIVIANGILANSATSATLTLTTGGESYLPGVITSAIDLYAPIVNIGKSVTDINGGDVQIGDILEYSIAATNQRDANGNGDPAINNVLRDPIPANTTYVPGSLKIDGASKTDASGDDQAEYDSANNRLVYRLGTGANASNGGTLSVSPAAGSSTTIRFRVTVNSGIPNGTLIDNQAQMSYNGQTLGTGTTLSDSSTTATVLAKVPQLRLVKRITGINTSSINTIIDPSTTSESDDNAANWPASYLRGAIDGGLVKPADEVEYTIYFLSDGGVDATNVRICDLVPANTTFIPTAYNGLTPTDGGLPGVNSGMALALGSTTPTAYLTNVADTDRGQFFAAGATLPTACSGSNTNGAAVVNVVTRPTNLPRATAPGSPSNSYGFVRFRVRVN